MSMTEAMLRGFDDQRIKDLLARTDGDAHAAVAKEQRRRERAKKRTPSVTTKPARVKPAVLVNDFGTVYRLTHAAWLRWLTACAAGDNQPLTNFGGKEVGLLMARTDGLAPEDAAALLEIHSKDASTS